MAAADVLVGTHDFKSFTSLKSDNKSTVRTINYIDITKVKETIKIEVNGDGFLINMVRIIVGTLINVGRGKTDSNSIVDIINKKDRTLAGDCVPPHGLLLKEVYY